MHTWLALLGYINRRHQELHLDECCVYYGIGADTTTSDSVCYETRALVPSSDIVPISAELYIETAWISNSRGREQSHMKATNSNTSHEEARATMSTWRLAQYDSIGILGRAVLVLATVVSLYSVLCVNGHLLAIWLLMLVDMHDHGVCPKILF